MNIKHEKIYNTSTDYKLLTEFLKQGKEIICFINAEPCKNTDREIARTRSRKEKDEIQYDILCRGIYFSNTDEESFYENCIEIELSFILPKEEKQ